MGVSSARPDNLEQFSSKSRSADRDLDSALKTLVGAYSDFQSENKWGTLDADSLLSAFGRYIRGNGFTARWVAQIAAAFRRAGGSGAIARLPDAAIKASLRAAGLDHDRHSVTFDGPVAYGSPPTTGYTNDPVNTATGNFVEVESDLHCSGLVEALTFQRTYNSRNDRVGPSGRGWSSWATTRLRTRPDGVEYIGPDGQEALFPRMGDGYGRIGEVSALVEPLASGLALTWFGGAGRWEFDEAGCPVSVNRGPGTEVALRHDADGRLIELAHGGGKHVRLEWDDKRISGVQCSDGRRASYQYDDSANLVEVDGESGIRRYELDESGRLASAIDADGVVELFNTYDDDGRVLEQWSPFGRHTFLSYLPGRVTVTTDDDEDGPVNTYIHDAAGRLLALVAGDDHQLSMSYDEWGNQISLTERNGAVTRQEWDDRARPRRRVLPSGAEFSFAYDDADRLVEVASSTGAVTRYAYDGDERNPVQIVDPGGAVTQQTVQDGLVRRIVDPDGVARDFEFDADGNLVAAIDGGGNTARVERDAAGRVTAAVTPLGRRSTFSYDAQGLLLERRDASGGVWRHEYTAAGRLAAVTDPTGVREETRYGKHGEPTAFVDPLGHVTTSEYDTFGNVVGVVEPDGGAWRHTYDALMRLTATVDPLGGCWEHEYDPNGTLVAKSAPDGVKVTAALDPIGRVIGIADGFTSIDFELDELGRVVELRRPDGTRRRTGYDLCGRPMMAHDATGAITRWEYTPAGRLARVLHPAGRADTYEYDPRGALAAFIDGAGSRWEFAHDPDGALVERRLPTGEIERIEYDESGRKLRETVPGQGVTTYSYDELGRVAGVSDREAGHSRFAFDPAGRLIAATDANGETTRYGYDELGRLTMTIDPLGGTCAHRYDAVGREIELTDQLGRCATMSYNPAGRVTQIVDGSGRDIRLSYGAGGRMTSFGPADGPPTTIEYDALGRIAGLAEPGSSLNRLRWDPEGRLVERSRGDLAMRWAYNADGERAAVGYPDGTQTTYTHDAAGYVVTATHPGLGTIELQRDAAGRLVAAIAEGMQASWSYEDGDLARYEMHAGGRQRTAELSRDSRGRIARATIDGATHRFAYDAAGQLVSASTPAGEYEFAYDANGRLARESSAADGAEYVYDEAGQLLSRTDGGVTRFTYDGAGRRVRETGPELDRQYRWDALGRLSAVEQTGSDDQEPVAMSLTVDALGELADVEGKSLMWDTAHPLEPLTWNGGCAVVGEGSPWALVNDGAPQWLVPDWQGTVGDLARDPWGAVADAAGALGVGTRIGYRGELELGTAVWLRNRVYEPAMRSFPTPDPLLPMVGVPAAANPYGYAANNPAGLADPLGLRPVTEQELNAIRDRMDANIFQKGVNYVVDHASDISAIAGAAALVLAFTPVGPILTPVLAGVSIATASISAVKNVKEGDYLGAGLDLVGVVGAGAALKTGRSAERAITSAVRSAKGAERLRAAGSYNDEVAEQWARSAARRKDVAVARDWKVKEGESYLLGLTGASTLRDQWLERRRNPGSPHPFPP